MIILIVTLLLYMILNIYLIHKNKKIKIDGYEILFLLAFILYSTMMYQIGNKNGQIQILSGQPSDYKLFENIDGSMEYKLIDRNKE